MTAMDKFVPTAEEAIRAALEEYGRRRFEAGLETGLRVAETIRAWLTYKPDCKWQAEVRGWADKAIARARKGLGNE